VSGAPNSARTNADRHRLWDFKRIPAVHAISPGTAIYIGFRDERRRRVVPNSQTDSREGRVSCAHGQGYTTFEHNSHAIEQRLLTFVPVDDAGESRCACSGCAYATIRRVDES